MNIGIIGYGKMGRLRHAVIDEMGGHEVVHICDLIPNPVNIRQSTDPECLINDKCVDVVFVCTPNNLTKEMVIGALNSGKHVFAEKPPGISVAQVNEMIAAENRNRQQKLMFGFNHRHHESVKTAKQHIDTGEFGNILWMRGRYGKSVDQTFFENWRAKQSHAGGGILMDQGIHMLDLLMFFAGGFHEVKSFCSNLYWKLDVEDNVFAILKNNKNNIVASLHSTMTQWRHLFALEIFLERGYMVLNGLITSSMSYTTPGGKEVLTIATNRTPPPRAMHASEKRLVYSEDGSWLAEMTEFFNAIETDAPITNGNSKDSLALMRMIEQIYIDGNSMGKIH